MVNDSVQRLSWPSFLFSTVLLGARLHRAGKLVSLLFLSAYESSAFEYLSVGQWGACFWKIFSLGVLVTVRMRELVFESRLKWLEASSGCSGSWRAAGREWHDFDGFVEAWAFSGNEELGSWMVFAGLDHIGQPWFAEASSGWMGIRGDGMGY